MSTTMEELMVIEQPTVEQPKVEQPKVEQPIAEQPMVEQIPMEQIPVEQISMAQPATNGAVPPKEETTWIEEIEIAGSQLVERVKEVIAEGNVRRLILRTQDDKLIMEIPLTAGAVVGGVVTLFAPLLAGLGALAALIAHVKVQIVRVEDKTE